MSEESIREQSCPACGQGLPEGLCDIERCLNAAKWELWWGVGSGGLLTRMAVCENHKNEEMENRKKRGKA